MGPLPLLIYFDALVFSCRVQSLLLRHGVSPIYGPVYYLEFLSVTLLACIIRRFWVAERLRHVLKVFATFIFSFIFSK